MSINPTSPATCRAFLCLLLACSEAVVLSVAEPGYRPPPHLLGTETSDQAEARQALQELRHAGIAGGYWLSFEVQVLPRQGEERLLRGQLFGIHSDLGPLTRLSLAKQEWLIRSGPKPAMWHQAVSGVAARQLTAGDALEPVAGTDLTAFDIQMPFLYWDDFVYEGLAKIRGRPAYSFILYPPADLAAARPDLTGVRVALDTQFHALVQAEQLGPKGESRKTMTVLDLKKVGEQWLPKQIDYRNQVTRDKTRFNLTAAALNLSWPAADFSLESLGGALPSLDGVRIESL